MSDFTKRERVECVLSGKLADRPPVTAYRHFPMQERKPEDLAGIMLDWQNKYDWDIIKVHPTAVYMQEVYGDKFDYDHYVEEIFPTKTARATDCNNLNIFTKKNMDDPVLKDMVKSVDLIMKGRKEDIPVYQTLFTPMTVITNVFECPFVRRHFPAERSENKIFEILKTHEDDVLQALDNITDTYIEYWRALRETGVDGLFYAGIAWAREGYMTMPEWEKYIKHFDLKFLNEVKKDGGRVMYHTCGMQSNPQRFVDYPMMDILHWDQGAKDNPQIPEAMSFLGNITPMGGVDEMIFGTNSAEKIAQLTEAEVRQNKDIPFILAPYCSVSIHSSEEELFAFRKGAECMLHDNK